MIRDWFRRVTSFLSKHKSRPIYRKPRLLFGLEWLEDRTVPTGSIVAAADAGAPPEVRVYDFATGALRSQFLAYDSSMLSGVRVAVGDVNGDGFDDLITAPGPGALPNVRVFDGLSGNLMSSFFAYDGAFQGGVFVATGDIDGDGRKDIITGVGPGGGPNLKVFRGDGTLMSSFFAYNPAYSGGVRVAAGDVNGDGRDEIITGVGFGGGPHVQAFDLASGTPQVLSSFYAYQPNFTAGIFVAAGDIDGDGRAEIITGAGAGGGPHVQAFDARGNVKLSFFAFSPAFNGGVRVAAADVNNDGRAEILAGTGYGTQPVTAVFNGQSGALQVNAAFPSGVQVGIYVAMSRTPLNLPSTPSDQIQAAYNNLALIARTNQPIIVIQQNNRFLGSYPYGIYGFGYGTNYPYFYDAPGLFYSPDYFYSPGYFSQSYFTAPTYVTPYTYDSFYNEYYSDPYYYDGGGYSGGGFDGGGFGQF